MGEIIRCAPKLERERARVVRKARAIYDSLFPPSECARDRPDNAYANHMGVGADIDRGDRDVS
ncbi:hypothetical protein [Bradyrhizobium sp. UNPA324]|uniref:hypothetical protein n=1 Tax=Bradyrhizobium sp. UNPA324 TaxID=1141174 RepID=UPI001152538F|nr:hypothetical protein [Bradyrhizobium sp. UNPA324]